MYIQTVRKGFIYIMNVSQQNVMPCTDISVFIFHTNDFQNYNFSAENELITFFLIHLL